jgi:hypothetical protein
MFVRVVEMFAEHPIYTNGFGARRTKARATPCASAASPTGAATTTATFARCRTALSTSAFRSAIPWCRTVATRASATWCRSASPVVSSATGRPQGRNATASPPALLGSPAPAMRRIQTARTPAARRCATSTTRLHPVRRARPVHRFASRTIPTGPTSACAAPLATSVYPSVFGDGSHRDGPHVVPFRVHVPRGRAHGLLTRSASKNALRLRCARCGEPCLPRAHRLSSRPVDRGSL